MKTFQQKENGVHGRSTQKVLEYFEKSTASTSSGEGDCDVYMLNGMLILLLKILLLFIILGGDHNCML